MNHYVYIVRCADNSYYVGSTRDVELLVLAHNNGKAAEYTAARRPVQLVYSEKHQSIEPARARELQIKRWTRSKKEALISGRKEDLKRFSRKGYRAKKN
jgi:putative endonuclease